MANLTITNLDRSFVVFESGKHVSELLTFAGAGTVLEGTILARKAVADAIVAAADGGNTGNGTVTLSTVVAGPAVPIVGAHNLECISTDIQNGIATATAVLTGTGDGTLTALTVNEDAPLASGAYNFECTALGVANGTAVGAAVSTGTGDGTASAVAPGSAAEAGAYIATCIDASVSGSEIFNVITPSGQMLENLTVGVAYSNSHFGITISDGSAQFIVGDFWTITMTSTGGLWKLEDPNGSLMQANIIMDAGAATATVLEVAGLAFTLTDGTTDFIVGDSFAITVVNTGGLWKLVDPNLSTISSNIVMDAGALSATLVEIAGMTFTLTDGATDFIVGDKFSLTVAADGTMYPYAVAGIGGVQKPLMVLDGDSVATSAGTEAIRPMKTGGVRADLLIIHADGDATNITSAILDELRSAGIYAKDATDDSNLDNQ